MRRLPKSHCRAVAPIRLPKVSLIKVNTCCHRETAGEVSSVLLPGINYMNGLNHNALTCSAVPIPPRERSLQTVEAQPYFNVSQASLVLEGIVFDRNNNLLFVDVATGRVFKLTPGGSFPLSLRRIHSVLPAGGTQRWTDLYRVGGRYAARFCPGYRTQRHP